MRGAKQDGCLLVCSLHTSPTPPEQLPLLYLWWLSCFRRSRILCLACSVELSF